MVSLNSTIFPKFQKMMTNYWNLGIPFLDKATCQLAVCRSPILGTGFIRRKSIRNIQLPDYITKLWFSIQLYSVYQITVVIHLHIYHIFWYILCPTIQIWGNHYSNLSHHWRYSSQPSPVAMVFPRRSHRSPGSPAATGGASPGGALSKCRMWWVPSYHHQLQIGNWDAP